MTDRTNSIFANLFKVVQSAFWGALILVGIYELAHGDTLVAMTLLIIGGLFVALIFKSAENEKNKEYIKSQQQLNSIFNNPARSRNLADDQASISEDSHLIDNQPRSVKSGVENRPPLHSQKIPQTEDPLELAQIKKYEEAMCLKKMQQK